MKGVEEAEAAIGQLEPDFGPVGQLFLISLVSPEFAMHCCRNTVTVTVIPVTVTVIQSASFFPMFLALPPALL